jgi:protein tyrosine/serine phosphatase
VVWREVIRDRVVVKRWGVVEPGRIFRSGQISPYLIRQVLENNRIGMVVDLTGDDPTNDGQPAERQAISELGIDLRKCPLIGDGTGDIRQYAAAVQAIVEAEAAGKPVLIHCSAGAQRTGGTIAAYRILVQGWKPERAWQEMQDYGWDPSGDGVLVEYLNSHMRELAGLLVAADAISEVPDPLPQLPE